MLHISLTEMNKYVQIHWCAQLPFILHVKKNAAGYFGGLPRLIWTSLKWSVTWQILVNPFYAFFWITARKLMNWLYPLHIHRFLLRVLTDRTNSRIYTNPFDLATFTTDLTVVTSYYMLFMICYELSRITTINWQPFYDLITCCTNSNEFITSI